MTKWDARGNIWTLPLIVDLGVITIADRGTDCLIMFTTRKPRERDDDELRNAQLSVPRRPVTRSGTVEYSFPRS